MQQYAQLSQLITEGNCSFESGLAFVDFLYSGRIVYHKVAANESGRLDLIAYKYFSDPSLWYLIAIFNNLFDPLSQCSPGTTLTIPLDAPSNTQNLIGFTYPGTT